MHQVLIDYQVIIRLFFFLGVFGVLAWWESYWPWRFWLINRRLRWLRHFSLALLSQLAIKILFPFLALGVALEVEAKGIGFLNHTAIPYKLKILLGVFAMDLVMYWEHRMLHKFSLLWRLHRVHHIDRMLDVSTGLRFHPFEEIVTMASKIMGITLFGVTPLAVLLFEILFSSTTLYSHVNVRLKPSIERLLKNIFVTPGMHRIHHSDFSKETNSNYGFCFIWWDKIFNSYTSFARAGELKLIMGLEEYKAPKYQTLGNMLLLPFPFQSLKPRSVKLKKIKYKNEDEIFRKEL